MTNKLPATGCPSCGTAVTGGARFCAHCGEDVRAMQQHVATTELDALAVPDPVLERLRAATLGEYEVYGELGRGGMAVVYLAHDIALDRKVAIKVMLPELTTGPGMAERFKREARTAGGLSHPHIIPIYAVREGGGLFYFVMKFVEGRGLDSIIAELGPLPIPMVQTVLAQVAGTLAHAHRKDVIHRDVKPANIMIDEDGWAVVTDFGVAKVHNAASLTSTGAAIGTPLYMSPEQGAGKPVTGASDQYSLGVTAYEMLTGVPPFNGPTVMEVMSGHYFTAPQPVRTLRPDCPEALEAVVMRMLEKHPDDRFPSLDDVVTAVAAPHLAHDSPVRAQMVALAKSQEHLRPKISVPTSPSPPTHAPRRASARAVPDRKVALVVGFVVLLAGAFAVGRLALRPGGQRAAPDSARSPAQGAPPPKDTAAALVPSPPAAAPRSPTAGAAKQPALADHTRGARPDAVTRTSRSVTAGTGHVVIGTHVSGAVYYVNGTAAGVLTGLQYVVVAAGRVQLSIKVEGCTAWDSTLTVPANDTLRLGYRSPRCGN